MSMTPEQIQIYLKRVQSTMIELPIYHGSERFPEFHELICEAFDKLVAAQNLLKRKLDESTGLALSPAQPVEAVGQGTTINEFPSFQQLNADYLVVGFFTHWGDEPTKEQIEEFAVRVNAFMFAGFNEHKSRVLAFDTIIYDRDGK